MHGHEVKHIWRCSLEILLVYGFLDCAGDDLLCTCSLTSFDGCRTDSAMVDKGPLGDGSICTGWKSEQ